VLWLMMCLGWRQVSGERVFHRRGSQHRVLRCGASHNQQRTPHWNIVRPSFCVNFGVFYGWLGPSNTSSNVCGAKMWYNLSPRRCGLAAGPDICGHRRPPKDLFVDYCGRFLHLFAQHVQGCVSPHLFHLLCTSPTLSADACRTTSLLCLVKRHSWHCFYANATPSQAQNEKS
jgi:hypothetical protein